MKKNKKPINYSVTEIAEMTETPYHRVIRAIKRGKFPRAYKVGWGWVIPLTESKLKEVIEENK